jgi:DNA-binding response OmpR family regulator
MTEEARGRAPVVALVDDEEDITTFLRLALQDEGFEVVTTNSATAALELLLASRPDLICLDLLMPEQTGLSLYAEISTHNDLSRIPIVILSGLAPRDELPGILQRAGDLPAPAAFLEKPLDAERLLTTVRGLLGRPAGGAP